MSVNIYKDIPVSPENYDRIINLSTVKDSLNDVVTRLLDKAEGV